MSRLETLFPDLKIEGYQQTSQPDAAYNCVAWAAGDSSRWWESAPGYYWPVPESFGATIDIILHMFKWLGFSECDSETFESGVEKIAIYEQDGEYTHVARQLPSGKWTSKIGALEDIEHENLDGLLGTEYGLVGRIMRRDTRTSATTAEAWSAALSVERPK